MGIIDIELISEKRPWGLFTEEIEPRIILPTWLTQTGQTIRCEEEDLTPNQKSTIADDCRLGIIKVRGASFIEETKPKKARTDVFDVSSYKAEETPFAKKMKEMRKRKVDPTIDQEEVLSFLRKRQDKLIVQIKKNEKPLSFLKVCKTEEEKRAKPRKKVLEALQEAIEYRLASVTADSGGIKASGPQTLMDTTKGLSDLESQYSDLVEEKILEEPEPQKEFSKEELEALLEKFKSESS